MASRPRPTQRPAAEKSSAPPAPRTPPPAAPRWAAPLVILALLLGTVALYWPVRDFDFVGIDDPDYVTGNFHVNQGLTRDGCAWAWSSKDASNWHPLTWFSHMLDCQLFGLRPAGHHLVNVGLHALNAILLFLFLRLATRRFWSAAFIAAVFAWHPLRVESVAWVSERKDVLSGCFAMLSLLTYTRYAQATLAQGQGRTRWFNLSLFLFALGLMSKPMLVTLPFVLLLLDFWPLQRATVGTDSPGPDILKALRGLLPEKVPFFVLSLISCGLTIWAQGAGHSIGSVARFPPILRVENAILSVGTYVWRSLWPTQLAVFYPYPETISLAKVIGEALLLGGITWYLICSARRNPGYLVAWLWFLIMLIPVIGLVQVGDQAWADRYTYLPGIGLLLLATAGWQTLRAPRLAGIVLAFGLLSACAAGTWSQIQVWRNTRTLFEHAAAVTRGNYLAWTVLGTESLHETKFEEALRCFETAMQLRPAYPAALSGRAQVHMAHREFPEAVALLDQAAFQDPFDAEIQNVRASALAMEGKLHEAEAGFLTALRLRPGFSEAHFNLAKILLRQANLAAALENLQQAARLNPSSIEIQLSLAETLRLARQPEASLATLDNLLRIHPASGSAHYERAQALLDLGRTDQALDEFKALNQDPELGPSARDGYGFALAGLGRLGEAESEFQSVLRKNPKHAGANFHYAMLLAGQGHLADAVQHYRTSLEVNSNQPAALNNLAWILATAPQDQLRNGAEAVARAQLACELTGRQEPFFLGTLAAALAESGDFRGAVATAETARALAIKAGRKELTERNDELLKFYRAGQPFHDVANAH